MRKIFQFVAFSLFLLVPSTATYCASIDSNLSDDEIRKILIRQSIEQYPGNCPCPYNAARNGSRCGKRSAWSKPGGYSPLCYPSDVSEEAVKAYRADSAK